MSSEEIDPKTFDGEISFFFGVVLLKQLFRSGGAVQSITLFLRLITLVSCVTPQKSCQIIKVIALTLQFRLSAKKSYLW